NGELWLYAGNGAGGWAGAGRLVNTRFGAFDTIVGPGDFTGDGRNDILGRTPTTGELYLYPGNGAGGWFTGRRIGTGW
ncbi:MAG TPA: VCBS repeat-containing protein, partial [Chloroflexota bacterium]|nr:VCBS repeat-containing protein [Chloroflexota bacterium]